MRREADDLVGTEQPPRQARGRVVLPDVNPVGVDVDGEVGSVIEDERDAMVMADVPHEGGAYEQGPRIEHLVAQLHDVDAAGDARGDEVGEVRPIGRAEVEPADQTSALAAALAARFFSCL